jgi:hypothetical protein
VFRLRGSLSDVRVHRAFGRHGLFCDGRIRERAAEWIAFQNKVFAMLDKKKTGKVDEPEYMAASPEVASFATGGYASGLLTPEMFKKIDTDGDGTISQREFLSYQLRIFDMMDTSSTHKGMLGPGEFFATGGAPAP